MRVLGSALASQFYLFAVAPARTPRNGPLLPFIFLGPISLADGDRIESVEIVIDCGRFKVYQPHPKRLVDRSQGPFRISTLKVSSDHGSSALWSSRDLDGFVTIMNCAEACFDIKAKVGVFVGEKERTVSFSRREIILKPSP